MENLEATKIWGFRERKKGIRGKKWRNGERQRARMGIYLEGWEFAKLYGRVSLFSIYVHVLIIVSTVTPEVTSI